ncbi:hypothetical protein [Nocardia sp. NBC_00511]|uniref:hypothetical protein n=1 Tax=Nocardia sp. NBC_00511 TaxID=2903591 RepID=UPI0030E4D8BD
MTSKKTKIVDLSALYHLMPETRRDRFGASDDHTASSILTAVHAFGIDPGEKVMSALDHLAAAAKEGDARIAKYRPRELSEADLDHREATARLLEYAANSAAYPIACKARKNAVHQASRHVYATVLQSCEAWIEALNETYVAEHDALYLADENNIDEAPSVAMARKARRDLIETLYNNLLEYSGESESGDRATLILPCQALLRYELTVEQFAQLDDAHRTITDLPRYMRAIGAVPRLRTGGLGAACAAYAELEQRAVAAGLVYRSQGAGTSKGRPSWV